MTEYTNTRAETNTQTVSPVKVYRGNFLLLQLILNTCQGFYCNLLYETEKRKYTNFAFFSRFIYSLAWSSV